MPCPAPLTVNLPFAKLALPAKPTEPMSPSDHPEGSAVTVNEALFTVWLLTVTETGPEVAPDGTSATMLVSLQVPTAEVVPLSEIVLPPCVVPKPVPVIVTSSPTAPEVGDMAVIASASNTVKFTPLLATPHAVTTTLPVVASTGTETTMLVALQLVGAASVPLKLTVPAPCVAPKPVPVIVTGAPTTPEVTERLLIVGAGTTVKLVPLLATPDALTKIFPVVAPDGTGTEILDALQLVGVDVVPLKLTEPLPWVAPKFVPATATSAPTAPLVGERVVMLGGGTTVKLDPLLATPPAAVTTTLPVVAPLGVVAVMLFAPQLVIVVALVPL